MLTICSPTPCSGLLQALLAFIGDCPDVAMLEDVLIAILDLLRHTPPGRIPGLAGASGAQLFVSLLSREQPALRILGLHLLAHFVPYIQSGAQPGWHIHVPCLASTGARCHADAPWLLPCIQPGALPG